MQGIADYGVVSTECLCGCNVFKICVVFDEDGEISWYTGAMYCYACGAKLVAPMPGVNFGMEDDSIVTV